MVLDTTMDEDGEREGGRERGGGGELEGHLPIANITRIMKQMLPPQGKISKDAKETLQECVTEFICFITSEVRTETETETESEKKNFSLWFNHLSRKNNGEREKVCM